MARVSVFLLTGYLGSGKTTLLKKVLEAPPLELGRMAVIVNEFGQVGIDADLLPPAMSRQVELPGGCVCCVLNDELDKTIVELVEENPEVETLVIETTGIAEPIAIAWTLEREPLAQIARLAAVVTTVDGLEHEANRQRGPQVDAQVEYADVIVLTKGDLPRAQEARQKVLQRVRSTNERAAVLEGADPQIASMLWLALADPAIEEPLRPTRDVEHMSRHLHVESVAVEFDFDLDFEELAAELEALPPSYFRIKGIARGRDGESGSHQRVWMTVHRVGARYSQEPLAGARRARLVAIGEQVSREVLSACLERSRIEAE